MGEVRPSSASKTDFESSFSDADSGYEDPGVLLTIPVTKTLIRSNPDGRKISSTSTEWICVRRSPDEVADEGHVPRRGRERVREPLNVSSGSVSSLSSPQFGSDDPLNNSSSSLEALNESGVSSGSNYTMTSVGSDDVEVSNFRKERTRKTDRNRKLRLLARYKSGRNVEPISREVSVSNDLSFTEDTTRKTSRRKGRSKSADGRRVSGPQNLFSPYYTKILSPETMRNRKIWADALKRDCILEEEYYKIPYEECNREIILGRLSDSETLLNNFRRMRRERLLQGGDGMEAAGDASGNLKHLRENVFNGEIDERGTNRLGNRVRDSGRDSNQDPTSCSSSESSPNLKNNATTFLKELIEDLEVPADVVEPMMNTESSSKRRKGGDESVGEESIERKSEIEGECKIKEKKRVSFSPQREEMIYAPLSSDYEDFNTDFLEEETRTRANDCADSQFEGNDKWNHDLPSSAMQEIHDLRSLTQTNKENQTKDIHYPDNHFMNDTNTSNDNYFNGNYDNCSCNEDEKKMEKTIGITDGVEQADDNNNKLIPVLKTEQLFCSHPLESHEENGPPSKKTESGSRERGNKVNILMTKGQSFTDHQIHLLTRSNPEKRNVSVRRIRVPFSSIRDQWEMAVALQMNADKAFAPDKDFSASNLLALQARLCRPSRNDVLKPLPKTTIPTSL